MTFNGQHLKSLHVKVSLAVAAASLVLTLIFSISFYRYSYQSSIEETSRDIQQLLETSSSTASIAAYVNNKELAEQVVLGLTKSNIIVSAKIIANANVLAKAGENVTRISNSDISINLRAPFDSNEMVGSLTVRTNYPLIAQRAKETAEKTTLSLAGQAGALTIIVLLLVYWMMSKPLTFLSLSLHNIVPGDNQSITPLKFHNSDEIGFLVKDINALLATVNLMLQEERLLRHRVEMLEHQFRGIFEDSSAGIFLVHEDGSLVNANPAFFKITNNLQQLGQKNQNINVLSSTFATPDQARGLIKLAIVSKRPCSGDLLLASENNHQKIWVHCIFSLAGGNQVNPIVEGVMYDITKRKIAEEKNRELAEKDGLTNLSNRQAAETALKELTLNIKQQESGFVVMMVDLDRFKFINDTYGHDAGDWVLKIVANRLRKNVRSSDIVARLGGDEFLIILTQTDNHINVKHIAEKLLAEQQEAIEVQPGFFETLSMSIGIAFYDRDKDNEMSIRKHADQAMYAVKRSGKNGYAIYSEIGKHDVIFFNKSPQ